MEIVSEGTKKLEKWELIDIACPHCKAELDPNAITIEKGIPKVKCNYCSHTSVIANYDSMLAIFEKAREDETVKEGKVTVDEEEVPYSVTPRYGTSQVIVEENTISWTPVIVYLFALIVVALPFVLGFQSFLLPLLPGTTIEPSTTDIVNTTMNILPYLILFAVITGVVKKVLSVD